MAKQNTDTSGSTVADNNRDSRPQQQRQGLEEITGPNRRRKTEDDAFDEKHMLQTIVAWDQIRCLTSDLASSVLAKQASEICDHFRGDDTCPRKRRKLSSCPGNVESTDDEEESDIDDSLLPDTVSHQIDRIARMSKIMMDIEESHRLLRAEMLDMVDGN